MRKITAILFMIILFAPVKAAALSAPLPPAMGLYVNDPDNLIYREHRDFILENSRSFYEKTGVQIVVVAVRDLSGLDAPAYSEELLTGWSFTGDIGEKAALILLSASERLLHIAISGDYDGGPSPEQITGAYEVSAPYLEAPNYSKAVYEAYKSVLLSSYENSGVVPGDKLIGELAPGTDKGLGNPVYYATIMFVAALFIGLRGLRVSRKYQKKFAVRKYYKRKSFIVERRPFDDDERNVITDLPYSDNSENGTPGTASTTKDDDEG